MKNSTPKAAVDKSPERIAGMFDRVAPRYDFLNHLLSLGVDRLWRRKTVREVIRRSGDAPFPLLDVATGTADLAIAFGHKARKGAKRNDGGEWGGEGIATAVTGVDFSPEMLRLGKVKVRRRQLDSLVRLQAGDGEALPFPDNSFAAVTVAFGLRNMADTDRGIAEMVRVCRPGGTVAVLEFTLPTLPIIAGLYRFYFFTILPRIGRLFSRGSDSAYRYLPESVSTFDSIPTMTRRFENAGLTEIGAIRLTFGVVALYLGRKTMAPSSEPESEPGERRNPR